MRYGPEHKVEVHQKIVKDASRRVRVEGITGAAVSTVMRDAGLTHGGFYKHFGSKDDLLLEALSEAVRRQLFLWVDDNYFSRSTTTTLDPGQGRSPAAVWVLLHKIKGLVVGAVGMWESRSDFQGAVGRVENLVLVFQAFHGTVISTALSVLFSRGSSAFALAFRLLVLLGVFHAVTGNVQFDDHAMVHQAVDGSSRHHGVFEDRFPFGKRQIAGHQDAAAFVTLGQQSEHHFHVVPALLQVAQIVDDQSVVAAQAFDLPAQPQIPLGGQ